MKPDPRGDRLHSEGSGGVADREPIEGDELDDGALVGRQAPERAVDRPGSRGGVDPLLGRGDGVVLERSLATDAPERTPFARPLSQSSATTLRAIPNSQASGGPRRGS